MIDQTIEEKICKIIANELGILKADKDKSFEELDADSIDISEILMLVEDEFEIAICDVDVPMNMTVGAFVEYVEKLISESA